MFGIGDTEFVLIIIFAFLLFGPDKLPGMGRTIGRGLRQFREAQDSVTKVVQSEVIDPMTKAASAGADGVKAKVATDEDADIEAADLTQRSAETFAERKARLAAEKAARDAAAADGAAAAASDAADAPAVPASAEEPEPEATPETEAAPEPGANPRSAASLYGLAPKAPAAEPSTAAPEDPAPAGAADPAAGEEGGSRA
ncbi:Sec-independent protein translocase subunit TatA/TatB [Caniella muris]|uniref:Sec-independent protein translocase subunit TatA/TatB n=1 Tax=Caniella muris TaxID=2941502 RepID=UPI0023B935C5|nr:twin-arginine translocase TatA/TatE family subunit [Caniella muris]